MSFEKIFGNSIEIIEAEDIDLTPRDSIKVKSLVDLAKVARVFNFKEVFKLGNSYHLLGSEITYYFEEKGGKDGRKKEH